ncbi:MAG: arginine repressor [Nannocystaceae bacterium]
MSRPTRLRRAALRDLLASGRAATQDELCALLAERGYRATQSTVSRDLKRLGAQRSPGPEGTGTYQLVAAPRVQTGMVVAVEHNETMIVLRTEVGRAQAVGLDLDALDLPDVLGTLAGDDTVLVVPRSVSRTAELARHLRMVVGLPEGQPPAPGPR